MNMLPQASPSKSFALAALLLFGVLACSLVGQRRTPVQGWWSDRGPVLPHESFPADCSLCHLGDGWNQIRKDFTYDHLAETGHALDGAHAKAECLRCHNDRGPVQLFNGRGCSGCHEDPHRAQLGRDCSVCHAEVNWEPNAMVRRHARTRFPLAGAHAAADCIACHPGADGGEFTRADTACASCHAADLSSAMNPDHLAQGWTTGCERCHIPTEWSGEGFQHGQWPLTGAHRVIACEACHTGAVFETLPTACAACHQDDYKSANDPDHAGQSFPLECQVCHGTQGWEGAQFNHAGVSSGCLQCHSSDYQGTRDPDHVAENFPTTCELCHGTQSWEGALFSHAGITSGCYECHQDDYRTTSDPNHILDGFPTTCENCHSTRTWSGAMFSHAGITSGCYECHQTDYRATSDPNHASAGFPTSCEVCHSTRTWFGAQFNHTFPIQSGNHSGFACSECHTNPRNFQTFSCIDCHEHNDRQDTNNDHSRVSGYSYNSSACYSCHMSGR